MLVPEEPIVTVTIEGRPVAIRAWRYEMEGVTGHRIPIYFLDTNLEQNDPADRTLTDYLYGGDTNYRLRQEAILGIGGARMLQHGHIARIGAADMRPKRAFAAAKIVTAPDCA